MAIARVQITGGTSATNSCGIGFAANNTGGNLLIACIYSETDSATLTSLVDTRGNTWVACSVPLTISAGSGKGTGIGTFYAKNCAAGANTVTATCSAGPVYLHIMEYSGCDTTAPFDQHAEAVQFAGGSTPSSGATPATTTANELLIGHIANNRSVITAGTGYTVINSIGFNNFSDVEERIVAATGAYAADGTTTIGCSAYSSIATFKQAAATGGAADHLAVVTQPNNSVTNVAHSQQPVVAVKDVSGVTVSSDTSTVTASLITVTGTGTAIGTLTKACVSGQAFFTDLGVNSPAGGTFKWHFTDGTLTAVDSAVFTVSTRAASPYLNLGTDGKDLGYDKSLTDPGVNVALSGDRRSITEPRDGGANTWWSYNSVQRVQLPRTLISSDMPTWAQIQGMTVHSISGDTALLALLGGGTLGTGGHVVVLDNAVTYTGDYFGAFPLRPGGDAVPGGTNVCLVISKAFWDSMVANGGVCTIAPEKVRVSGPTNMATFESQVQLGNFCVTGATKGWRFVGLSFRPAAALTTWSHGVSLGRGDNTQTSALNNVPSNIILDRCWIDGTASCTTIHGFELHCAYGAIVDCGSGLNIYTRYTGESHVICGYNGPGPYRIVNNLIRGGTQCFFIGGATSDCGMPADFEFRYNYMTRPLNLNPADASYNQTGNYVKNIWELKVGRYILAEYNLAENVWPGAQAGASWLSKAESYGTGATIGYTADVLIRRNVTRNAGMGGNITALPNVDPATPPQRVWYYDNLFRIGAPKFDASTNPYFGLGTGTNCGIVHNTCISEGVVNVAIQFPDVLTAANTFPGLVIEDNIQEATNFKWKFDSGTANTTNDLSTITGASYTATKNAVIGANGTYPGVTYIPADEAAIVFEDVANKDFSLHGTTQGTVQTATQLLMVTQPSNGRTGVALATAPVVRVADASAATVTADASVVTAQLLTTLGSGTAIGTLTKQAVSGVADFSGNGLGVTSPNGGTFAWRFTDGSLTSVDSAPFTVVGTASKLAVQTQPAGAVSGSLLAQQPVVLVQDFQGNVVTTSTAAVTVAVTSGTATLTGTLTQAAVAGVVTFADLVLTGGGTVIFTFSGAGLTSIASAPFNVVTVAPPPTGLTITQQPAGAVSGLPMTTPPVLEVRDGNGSLVTVTPVVVTLLVQSTTGPTMPPTPVASVNGVVTFAPAILTGVGTVTLQATAAGFAPVTFSPVSVTAQPAPAPDPSSSTVFVRRRHHRRLP